MSQQLISRNADLLQLRNEGYDIQIIGDQFLLVHSIPYVNEQKETKLGILVSKLNISSNGRVSIIDHTTHFIGEKPCYSDGNVISGILNSSQKKRLHQDLEVDHYFSNKPQGGRPFKNYYDKMMHYISIISPPASQLDSSLDPRTFNVRNNIDDQSPFIYPDTNACRSEFLVETEKFNGLKIGIIGIGGTGSFVLDYVSKTPVQEIKLYDGDSFLSHNAFRAPGAASIDEVNSGINKAVHFQNIYGSMHNGVIAYPEYITEQNLEQLKGLDFIFLCIDKNHPKSFIIPFLISMNIPFIDVGLGLKMNDERMVSGAIRSTSYTGNDYSHIEKHISMNDRDDNIYATNIQISELNALNAAFAVIKWKKYLGFYLDQSEELHSVFYLQDNKIIYESN